jgi:hypothetical protein
MNRNRKQSAIAIGCDHFTTRSLSQTAVVSLLLLALVRPATAAAPTSNSSSDGLLTASGRVLLPDGSPAARAIVWAVCGDSTAGVALVHADEKGQFRLRHTFGRGASLNSRTEDWLLQASLPVPRDEARTTLARPVEIRLLPTREQIVSVTFQSRPVEGAQVVAIGQANYQVTGLTDHEGRARLRWPAAETEFGSLVALDPKLGVGGHLRKTPLSSPATVLQVALVPARPHTLRVVDAGGQPVAGVQLALECQAAEWMPTQAVEAAHVRTNAKGEALVPWLPRDLAQMTVDVLDPDWNMENSNTGDGLTTVNVLHLHAINGRLQMPAGADCEGLLILGCGVARRGGRVHFSSTRARRDGTFTVHLAADHAYSLLVVDSEWASDLWKGVVLTDDKAAPRPLALPAYPAAILSVRATRGSPHKPVAGAWLSLRTEDSTWKDPQRGVGYFCPGAWWQGTRTDRDGTARFAVGRGRYFVSFSSPNWREDRSIDIVPGRSITVDFDRPWDDKRTIAGRLTLDGRPFKAGPTTIVRAWSTEDRQATAEGVVLPDGRFTVGVDAADVRLFAFDAKGRRFALSEIGAADSAPELKLKPTGAFSGVVVDSNGAPLKGRSVRMVFVGTASRMVFQTATCDDRGRFRFDAVPVQTPMAVAAGQSDGRLDIYLDPGERRENVTLEVETTNSERQAAAGGNSQRESLEDSLKRMTRDARLAGMRLLVVLLGDPSKSTSDWTDRVLDSDEPPELLRYLVLTVFLKRTESKALLSRLGWEQPNPGDIELLAVDGAGTRLAAQRITVAKNSAAPEQMIEFVKRNAPPRRDARALLASARQEARDTGRRLWIVESGPRCGPCFLLARWMDDQHAILEKDYVLLKVRGIDEHFREVIDKLNPPSGAGIPWYAITEPDGTILATSNGPLGNTGFPYSVEGKRHLRAMLDRTARRLSVAERERLVNSLSGTDSK